MISATMLLNPHVKGRRKKAKKAPSRKSRRKAARRSRARSCLTGYMKRDKAGHFSRRGRCILTGRAAHVGGRTYGRRRSGGWAIKRLPGGEFTDSVWFGKPTAWFKNPGFFKSMTSGYRPSSIGAAIPVAVGILLNDKVTDYIGGKTGWDSGLKGAAVGVGSAGMALLIPKYGPKLFLGGLARVMIELMLPFVEKWVTPEMVSAPAAVPAAPAAAPALPAPQLSDGSGSRGSGAANPEDGEEFQDRDTEWTPDADMDMAPAPRMRSRNCGVDKQGQKIPCMKNLKDLPVVDGGDVE